MSPDGKYLVSGSQDCSVQIFDFEARVPLYHYQKLEKGRGLNKGSWFVKINLK